MRVDYAVETVLKKHVWGNNEGFSEREAYGSHIKLSFLRKKDSIKIG